jgi:small subunit ribosomal protein S21
MKVTVQHDNWDRALRKLKKKVADSNLLQSLRDREFYEKPSVTRKKSKSLARKRWNRYLSDQALPKKNY